MPTQTTTPSSSGTNPPSPTTKRARTRATTAAAVVAAAAAALLVVPAATGTTWGARLAEWGGRTTTDHYDGTAQVPVARRPEWLPGAAEDVTVERPGRAVEAGVYAGAVKIDAVVPQGWDLPAGCSTTGYQQPFDGGGTWPLSTRSELVTCPGADGTWTALLTDDHVYAWR